MQNICIITELLLLNTLNEVMIYQGLLLYKDWINLWPFSFFVQFVICKSQNFENKLVFMFY